MRRRARLTSPNATVYMDENECINQSIPTLRACSKPREQDRDKAKRAKKRNVQEAHEHFEAVLTVRRLTKRNRSSSDS